ncbi:MAG: hypothetical protein OXH69_22970 [Acidobacteria bacterium]|nr:hypothetical protein [Acidobacteriota bacterium]
MRQEALAPSGDADQPTPATGSAVAQTMRQPSGPSSRTLRPSRVPLRDMTSLKTAEVFLSLSVNSAELGVT